jgi:hypothetical protein
MKINEAAQMQTIVLANAKEMRVLFIAVMYLLWINQRNCLNIHDNGLALAREILAAS